MPLHMLPTTPAAEPTAIGTFLDTLIYDFLPAFAVWAGLMALIWIACAAITVAGSVIGIAVVTAIQEVADSRVNYFRCRSEVEDDQFITAGMADDDHAAIIDLDPNRPSREHHQPADAGPDNWFRGDDPA